MKKEILIVSLNWKYIGGTQKRAELLKKNFLINHYVEHIFINSYIKFNIFTFDQLKRNFRNFLRYRNKLNKYKVVIAFSNLPSLFSLLSKSTLITVITGSTYHYREAKFISKAYWILFLEPLIYLLSRKIIPAAPHLIPFYVKKTKLHKKVEYINGFIDLNRLKQNTHEQYISNSFSDLNLEDFMCLSSSLIGHKGILELLDVYSSYRSKLKNNYLKLIIIGNGPLLEDCFEFCREKGFNYQFESKVFNKKNDVFFTGNLENPLQIIQKCRLFLMPSFHEGLSNQLLEAIYTGIPIIASNCQGNSFLYSEILKENPDYINSKFLKLMPIIKNRYVKKAWVKELIFYSKNFKNIRYADAYKLINKFSASENFSKWESMVRNIIDMERNKIKT